MVVRLRRAVDGDHGQASLGLALRIGADLQAGRPYRQSGGNVNGQRIVDGLFRRPEIGWVSVVERLGVGAGDHRAVGPQEVGEDDQRWQGRPEGTQAQAHLQRVGAGRGRHDGRRNEAEVGAEAVLGHAALGQDGLADAETPKEGRHGPPGAIGGGERDGPQVPGILGLRVQDLLLHADNEAPHLRRRRVGGNGELVRVGVGRSNPPERRAQVTASGQPVHNSQHRPAGIDDVDTDRVRRWHWPQGLPVEGHVDDAAGRHRLVIDTVADEVHRAEDHVHRIGDRGPGR